MSPQQRLESLPLFLADGSLLSNRLVVYSRPTVTPCDLPTTVMELSFEAFARVTGMAQFEGLGFGPIPAE